jgi:hypothetical protein
MFLLPCCSGKDDSASKQVTLEKGLYVLRCAVIIGGRAADSRTFTRQG